MQLITVSELKERLAKGEKLNLVDVREPSENHEFNIGGELIPLGKIQRDGSRSAGAVEKSGNHLLLPQRQPQRSGLPDSGNAWFYQYKKSAGRNAGVEKLKMSMSIVMSFSFDLNIAISL